MPWLNALRKSGNTIGKGDTKQPPGRVSASSAGRSIVVYGYNPERPEIGPGPRMTGSEINFTQPILRRVMVMVNVLPQEFSVVQN